MLALVFPGQGSQAVGMGRDLAERFVEARRVLEEAEEALGMPLRKLCFEGPDDELRRTENTQPAILAVSVAAWRALSARVELTVGMAAGHSLGEYSALVVSGAIPLADAVKAVRARGAFMQAAVPDGVGAMAAVIGLTSDQVAQACLDAREGEVVAPANLNSRDQTVISGHAAAVERAGSLCKERGAKRVMPLAVSAPFHCALMEPAALRMEVVLRHVPVVEPRFPVLANVTAAPQREPDRIRELLREQIVSPVRWSETVAATVDAGATHFVELGPGRVLSGMIRRAAPEATVVSVSDGDSLERTLEVLP